PGPLPRSLPASSRSLPAHSRGAVPCRGRRGRRFFHTLVGAARRAQLLASWPRAAASRTHARRPGSGLLGFYSEQRGGEGDPGTRWGGGGRGGGGRKKKARKKGAGGGRLATFSPPASAQDEYRIKPVEEVKYMKNGAEEEQKIAARNQENLEKSASSNVRLKTNKEIPGLVHQPRANMHISESQQEFFRMLDEKIEKGRDYCSEEEDIT
uniref:Uncharacterized protein n=1 Tax=Equus asinus TaxID=9793 RepID=A0A9L0IFD8_EQUAS